MCWILLAELNMQYPKAVCCPVILQPKEPWNTEQLSHFPAELAWNIPVVCVKCSGYHIGVCISSTVSTCWFGYFGIVYISAYLFPLANTTFSSHYVIEADYQ